MIVNAKGHYIVHNEQFLSAPVWEASNTEIPEVGSPGFLFAQNEKTLYADLILAGITQLITVVLADKINHHEYIRSLKPLIA